ncbi:hypothetical protein H0E84_13340 [Luteimonas sp. SJ-92]|uniref:VOC domain-containing protein n=1 Tax=Luteimonas salinisoli TaxID=2752307 RepID=A0A853JFS0_9GAMM|nr:hypothetical protein [Luteimonas salinisoli]NZA27370.1 hypothetical protein [Luteimonas salinisoli]
MTRTPTLRGGRNIAMKVPPHAWDATVAFYRDVLGLRPLTGHEPAIGFEFGANQLWIDRAPALSQAEIWLQVTTDDIDATAARLRDAAIVRCDDIEPLGDGARSFWILSPASIVHLVSPSEREW